MNKESKFFTAALIYLLTFNAAAQQVEKDEYLKCAAYYFTLSVFSPSLVSDLTAYQAVQYSFALRAEFDGEIFSTKSDKLFIKKWGELDSELPRPVNAEIMAKFREKYDLVCKPLLQSAWPSVRPLAPLQELPQTHK